MAVETGVRASKIPKRTLHRPIASAPTHATQNSTSKPNKEQAERRETNTECWTCWTRRHVPKKEKKRTQGG